MQFIVNFYVSEIFEHLGSCYFNFNYSSHKKIIILTITPRFFLNKIIILIIRWQGILLIFTILTSKKKYFLNFDHQNTYTHTHLHHIERYLIISKKMIT